MYMYMCIYVYVCIYIYIHTHSISIIIINIITITTVCYYYYCYYYYYYYYYGCYCVCMPPDSSDRVCRGSAARLSHLNSGHGKGGMNKQNDHVRRFLFFRMSAETSSNIDKSMTWQHLAAPPFLQPPSPARAAGTCALRGRAWT